MGGGYFWLAALRIYPSERALPLEGRVFVKINDDTAEDAGFVVGDDDDDCVLPGSGRDDAGTSSRRKRGGTN